jgi:type III secretion protein HrpB1
MEYTQMNPVLQSKEFVSGLIEIVSQGISHNRLEDAEVVLACVRALRPNLVELDTFDAWLAIKRGFWQDAIRTLRGVDSKTSNWALGRALLAFCQFAQGDDEWKFNANEVMTNSESKEAIGLVKLLMGDKSEDAPEEEDDATTTTAGSLHDSMMTSGMYMRV